MAVRACVAQNLTAVTKLVPVASLAAEELHGEWCHFMVGRYIIALETVESILLQDYSDAKRENYVKLQSSHYSFPSMPFAEYRFVASLSRRRRLKS